MCCAVIFQMVSYFTVMLRHLTTRPVALFAVLCTLFALLATQVPLLHTLGYEFAAALGLVAGICGGFCALPLWRRDAQRIGVDPGSGAWQVRSFLGISIALELVLALPCAVMTLNALFVPNCAPFEGVLFFLLIPVFSLLFSIAAASLCASLFKAWSAYASFGVVVGVLLLHPLLQTLTQPQLFAYNHLFGMFVGFSWDEAQPALGTLGLYRITTLAWGAAMFSASIAVLRGGGDRLRRFPASSPLLALFAVSVLIVFLGVSFSDELGFSTSARSLAAALGETRQTAHFIIHSAPGAFAPEEFDAVAEEHEFRLAQVCTMLAVDWKGRINSYIYPDSRSKKRLLGTESSQIARPWMREIHLSQEGWKEAVKHEIAHVVASSFGPYLVRTPVLRELGLTEGLAMAVEWNAGNRTPHEYAADMLAEKILPSAEQFLTTRGFLTGASFSGYIASGSFCRWLIDAKGLDAMKRVYAADDVERGTGEAMARLETEWRAYLSTLPRVASDSAVTMWLFRRQSLFSKACPRAVTEKNRAATVALRGGRYAAAAVLYRESDAMAPNGTAVYGLCNAYLGLQRYDSMLAITRRMLADARRASSLLPLWLWRGDAARCTGDHALAASCYRVLVNTRPGGWIEDEARLKLAALSAPERVRPLLFRFFDLQARPGTRVDSLRKAGTALLREAFAGDRSLPLTRLLLARNLALDSAGKGEALSLFAGAMRPEFLRDCSMNAGDLFYRSGALDDAERHYSRALAASTSEMQRLDARDALERCAWKRERIATRTAGK